MSPNLYRPMLIALTTLCLSVTAEARSSAKPVDYSGIYACKGEDAQEGPYTGTVTLQRVPEHSRPPYSAYTFTLEVPGYGTYPGHAALQGRHMAIHFANTDPTPRDFGTGLATFNRNRAGQVTFTKFYYQPEFKGGNHGLETCVRQTRLSAKP